jgi:hypothetical protein
VALRENTHRAVRGEDGKDPYNQRDYHVMNKNKRKRGRKQESLKRLRNPPKIVFDPYNETLE